MSTYYTGLIAYREFGPKPPFSGAGWRVTFLKRPKRNHTTSGNEVIIHAANWNKAQATLSLILAALNVYHGDLPVFDITHIAWNDSEPEDERARRFARETSFATTSIPTACTIAAKSSRKKSLVYALSKYSKSVNLFSIRSVDMDPIEHFKPSPFPDDHTAYAQAILLAYGAIEELGFELRASSTKPSRINGSWNPKVLSDLQGRLLKGKINLDEPILWAIRRGGRASQSLRQIPTISKESWAHGRVRDSQVRIVDAIAHASWLRSRVAAHKTRELILKLSPYEISNVQHLARRLILESLGFWQ